MMSAKVEQSTNHTQNTATVAPASGSKISKFATKSGFLIPKNKLTGSLVPKIRGGKRGGSDAANEETNKQGQRKTKWGPDLTQDTAVRKGRALAYQTRVDQITQQLRLGKLEGEANQDLSSPSQIQDSRDHQESELLELEMREAIGEILKLNPSYKATADYKPLLKEAKVPIPIKENPAHSVLGLFFGPANDTLKRLEKETGANVRVYGTKADSGEKVEVTTLEGNEIHGDDELHVYVSADTYEKIDAAVALIELLVTPVSGNPDPASVTIEPTAAFGDVDKIASSHGTPSTDMPAVVASGGVAQPIVGSGPVPLPSHFQQHAGSWYSSGAIPTPVFPSAGFAATAYPSAPLISNPMHFPPSQFNPSTMPSIFGPRPFVMPGFSPVPENTSLNPSGPQPPQVPQRLYIPHPSPLGHTGAPRNPFLPVSQPTPIQSNVLSAQLLSANQSTPPGPPQFGRPVLSTPTSIGAGNMMPVSPVVTGLQGGPSVVSHPGALPNISPVSQQSALQTAGAAVNHTMNVPFFNSSSQSHQGLSPSLLPSAGGAPGPVQPVMPQIPMPISSSNVVPGSTRHLSPVTHSSAPVPPQSGVPTSGSAGAASFNAMNPPIMAALRPPQPSSTDFTFQPHRPQNPASGVAHRPNTQPTLVHPNQPVQPHQGSQAPSVHPAMHIVQPPPTIQGYPRPNIGNQMMQPRAQTSVNFDNSPTTHPGPPRHAAFPGLPAVTQMQPRNFNSAPPFINAEGISRAGVPMQFQQSYPAPATRPQNFLAPNQQFNSTISFQPAARPSSSASGIQQVYDPFLPTAVSINTQSSSNRAKMQRQESDPEYEDLMASVGVK